MRLNLIQHRPDSCWYEKMVSEKTVELVEQLNKYEEVDDKFPSSLFEIIKKLCKEPSFPDALIGSYDANVLYIYMSDNKDEPFIEIKFE